MNNLLRAHLLFYLMRILPRKFGVRYDGLRQPFFIFGSGRNGSTMLNRMLNQHSLLYLPSEQYFLGPSVFKFHYYNYAVWRDLVKIMVGELIPSGKSHTWDLRSLPDLLPLYLLPENQKKLQYLVDIMYRHAGAGKSDWQIWGDTTPLNTYYLPEVFYTFPDAKYLFLIRDGRDVVASYKKGGESVLGKLANPEKAAKHWMHSISKYEWLQGKTDVKLVHYEELVKNPEKELTDICHYLGVSFERKMLDFNEHIPLADMYNLPVHTNLKKPVFTSSIGNYVSDLTPNELENVSRLIESGLEKFRY